MTTIGLFELDSSSTLFYKNEFDKLTNEVKLKLHPVNFSTINQYLPFQFDKLTPLVYNEIIACNELGVDKIVIPNITLHFTIDQLNLPLEIKSKIVHPFDEVIKLLKKEKISSITIIGTRHTMTSEMLDSLFIRNGITPLKPSEDDIAIIDEIRLNVFKKKSSEKEKKNFNTLLKKYQSPIITCTELSQIVDSNNGIDLVKNQIVNSYS